MANKTYMSPNRLLASIKFIGTKSADHFAQTLKLNKNTISHYLLGKTPIRRHVAEHIYCVETLKHTVDLLQKTEKDIRTYLSAWDREVAMAALAQAQRKLDKMAKYIKEKHLPARKYRMRGVSKHLHEHQKTEFLPPKPTFN